MTNTVVDNLCGLGVPGPLAEYLATLFGLQGDQADIFPDRATAETTNIPPPVAYIVTGGFYTEGDGGGASYVRSSGSTAGGFQDNLGQWWELAVVEPNILQYGAVRDGVTDNYDVFNDAMTALMDTGTMMLVPPGYYVVDMSGVRTAILVRGCGIRGQIIGSEYDASASSSFSRMMITGESDSLFEMHRNSEISNFCFVYPDQVDPASPIAYPGTIVTRTIGQNQRIHDCVFVNSYVAIDSAMSSGGYGDVWIERNQICALSIGFRCIGSHEVFWFLNNIFSYGPGYQFYSVLGKLTELQTRTKQTTVAMSFEGAESYDAPIIQGNFFFAHYKGISISASRMGLCTITGNGFDAVNYGIVTTDTGYFSNANISGNFMNAYQDGDPGINGVCIELAGSAAGVTNLNISGNFMGSASASLISVLQVGPGSIVNISGNTLHGAGYQQVSGVWPAIFCSSADASLNIAGNFFRNSNAFSRSMVLAAAGDVSVTGNYLEDDVGISITGAVASLLAVGNKARDVTTAVNIGGGGSVTGSLILQPNDWDGVEIPFDKQPGFAANHGTQTFNSGTLTTATMDEQNDLGGNFASNTFTAPVRGVYQFDGQITESGTGATPTEEWGLYLVTSNRTYVTFFTTVDDLRSYRVSAAAFMDLGDTAKLQVKRVTGAGNLVTLNDADANFFTGRILI